MNDQAPRVLIASDERIVSLYWYEDGYQPRNGYQGTMVYAPSRASGFHLVEWWPAVGSHTWITRQEAARKLREARSRGYVSRQ